MREIPAILYPFLGFHQFCRDVGYRFLPVIERLGTDLRVIE